MTAGFINIVKHISLKSVPAVLTVKDLCVKAGNQTILQNISFEILQGQQWLLTGKGGVGKTLLAKALTQSVLSSGTICFSEADNNLSIRKVKLIEQWYRFSNQSNMHNFYYQQRYQNADAADAKTLLEDLERDIDFNNESTAGKAFDYMERLGLTHRIHAPLIQLSSGEQKKLQLIKAFLGNYSFIILDNPFVGIDKQSRAELNNILTELVLTGTHFLIISDINEIPSCITHIAGFCKGQLTVTKKEAFRHATQQRPAFLYDELLAENLADELPEVIADMKDVTIAYNGKKVLNNINWRINKSERWLLQGPNGAGKSTLLSLLTGDNPKAYSNEIYLFGKQRGSGETIWDIKKRIGYISPEMHWYYDVNTNVTDTLVSGFFDTAGLFRKPLSAQYIKAFLWLEILGFHKKSSLLFKELSVSEQRLLLIARAFIKNPPLIILDEPCQGLDDEQSISILTLIDTLMKDNNRTLIFVSHRKDQTPECITHTLILNNQHNQEQKNYIRKVS